MAKPKKPPPRGSFGDRWLQFKKDRRAYTSFVILMIVFFLSLPAELWCNNKPLVFVYDGKWHFPILFKYSERDFGGNTDREPVWNSPLFIDLLEGAGNDAELRALADQFEFEDEDENSLVTVTDDNQEFVRKDYSFIWPLVPYNESEAHQFASKSGKRALAAPFPREDKFTGAQYKSSWLDKHYLGTDSQGRDVLARLIYGFRVSMLFGVGLAILGTILGCILGGMQGYFAGWVDMLGQRLTEIWGSIPRLLILIILSAMLKPSATMLFIIFAFFAWMGISTYMRAEYLRARNLDYVVAGQAMGLGNFKIMMKHILPNTLTPVVTFFPFEVSHGIMSLVSLDFLGLGVQGQASLGELLKQGQTNLEAIWISVPTIAVLILTLTLLTFMGDGVRNAFDPRKQG